MATIAVFIALGGTGYAVTKLPRNSVGATQLKANSVTSAKIRARAVQRSDLAPAARIGTRGVRGPVGPAGATGATGPSETIQVKRPGVVEISPDAGGAATLATLTLDPGSWILDANTTTIYNPAGTVSTYFECLLQTAGGDILAKGVLRLGNGAGAVLGGHMPVRVAATFSVPTQVQFRCRHPEPAPGGPYADRTTFQATRTGSLVDR